MATPQTNSREIQGTSTETTKEAIASTITKKKSDLLEDLNSSFMINVPKQEFGEQMKKEILSLIKDLPIEQQVLFQNLSIISAETYENEKMLSDFYGLDIAIQEL